MSGGIVAKLVSPNPLPADAILEQSPIRWQLGKIAMSSALFSYYRYKLFEQCCQMLPSVMVGGESYSLQTILNADLAKDDGLSVMRLIMEDWKAETRYHEHTQDLVALLISVSDPLDPVQARTVIERWELDSGVTIEVFADERETVPGLRKLLYNYCLYNLTIDSLGSLLNGLREMNVSFKKKIAQLFSVKAEADIPLNSSQASVYARLRKKRSEREALKLSA